MLEWSHLLFIFYTGILGIQASKSASLGGQQILDCDLKFPNGVRVPYMLEWKKDGLEEPVFLLYDGYAPHYHKQFEDRVRLVNEIALEISHIKQTDEGWYECSVIYLDGNDNREANGTWIYLNVYIPPKIISSSPSSFHKPLGSNARMHCRAEGNPKPNATWTKDGRLLRVSSRIVIQTTKNDGSEVIIRNLQKQDGGIYTCTFHNDVGLIAQNVHLIVEGQAYIIGAPTNKTAVLGQRVQFTCQARGYPTNITYRWDKDEYNVNLLQSYGTRIIIQAGGSLVITIVEKEDMGWYQCRPSNGVGQDPEARAFLNVTYKPEVLTDRMQRSHIWALGFKAKLDCPVDANPPAYDTVWTKDGIVINYGTNGRRVLLGNGSLVVEKVLMSDSGNYRCTARSSIGTGDSQIVQVEVKDPPRFTVRPDERYFRQLGQSVNMPCVAVGTPYPTISWRKIDGILRFDNRVQQKEGNLTINGLIKSDHGIYECEARNTVQIIVTSTEIIVQNTTPHAPYNVSVTTSAFDATIRWIPAYSTSQQNFVIWYRSIVNNIASAEWSQLRVEPQNATRFTIYRLQPETLYDFKVLSTNELGSGKFSDIVQAKTLGYVDGNPNVPPTDETGATYFPPIHRPIGERPTSPTNVSVVLQSDKILVRWNKPETSPVTIFQYVVEYNSGDRWRENDPVKAPLTKLLFSPIEGGLTYSFRVVSHGLMAYSFPSKVVNIQTPDDSFGLSNAEIGGIIGGLLFLIVAITLAVVAVLCNRRRDKNKHQTKFGNVKYVGPHDDMDGRPDYASEWSDGPPPPSSPRGGGNTLAYRHDNTLVGTDNGIFMVPKSGDLYNSYNNQSYPSGDHSMYHDRDSLLRNREIQNVRGVPYHAENSSNYWDSRNYPEYVNTTNNSDRNSTLNRSKRSIPYDNGDDDNGFRDTVRMRHGSNARNRSRSQPAFRHSDGPTYPVPERPRSRGHSLPREPEKGRSFHDDTIGYGPQTQIPPRSPMYPQPQTPVLSPVVPSGYQGNQHSFHGDSTNDEDVFMPLPPMTNVVPGRPSFPRHSSMKPGALQTYLTEDMDNSGRPFTTNDISSVLPSPFSNTLSRHPYHPYQRQYTDVSSQNVPYGSQSRFPDQSRDGSYGDGENTVVARPQGSPDRTMSRTLSGGDSSDSSGRPFNYTRDQLLGAVDQVRRGQRGSRRGRGQQWGSGTDFSESPSLNGHGAQIPESAKPSVIVRDRPSRGFPNEQDPLRGQNNGNSHASVNSSGTGSYLGGRGGRNSGLVIADHSRSGGREDLTPDSISSGIGSRNTSSQLTGSSLHSRPSRLGSSLTPHDISHDSAVPLNDYPHPLRKDISGDENYEFDSYNAVESDLLEALRNYSEVNTGNEELLSALQEGLSTTGLMSELYPKPSRQSRYSDSEQRFEKLRGEFQQYRQQQQQDGSRSDYNPHSSRGSLRDYGQYQPRNDSYSSTLSSRQSGTNFQPPNSSHQSVRGSHSNYKAGPMDSDML